MRTTTGVLGLFRHLDALLGAIRALRQAGHRELTVISPVPRPEIEEALGEGASPGASPVRIFTLAGGVLGWFSGFALTIFTALDWPLRTSAKPIVSVPPFVIIAFELTILFGALATLLGLFVSARLPSRSLDVAYDPRLSEDRFGLFVRCEAARISAVKQALGACGAEELHAQGS